MQRESRLSIPPVLAVANIHPDNLATCVEHCCTGSKLPCRLPPGTVTVIRRTTGGRGTKGYGVVGIWYFTGLNQPVPRSSNLWSSRWGNKVVFEPIVRKFENHLCEDFSVSLDGDKAGRKTSAVVDGLGYTMLQGVIVTIKDPLIAVRYIDAIQTDKAEELRGATSYLGEMTTRESLLDQLKLRLQV